MGMGCSTCTSTYHSKLVSFEFSFKQMKQCRKIGFCQLNLIAIAIAIAIAIGMMLQSLPLPLPKPKTRCACIWMRIPKWQAGASAAAASPRGRSLAWRAGHDAGI